MPGAYIMNLALLYTGTAAAGAVIVLVVKIVDAKSSPRNTGSLRSAAQSDKQENAKPFEDIGWAAPSPWRPTNLRIELWAIRPVVQRDSQHFRELGSVSARGILDLSVTPAPRSTCN